MEQINYKEQAKEFCKKHGVELIVQFSHYGLHFPNDKDKRDIYRCTLKRKNREYTFNFGRSLADSIHPEKVARLETIWERKGFYSSSHRTALHCLKNRKFGHPCFLNEHVKNDLKLFAGIQDINETVPDEYSILACLTKSDPGSFADFCSDCGYDNDSISAEKTYRAVLDEWRQVDNMFHDVIDELQEIQ